MKKTGAKFMVVIGALVFAQVENQDIPLPIMVIFILVVIIPGFFTHGSSYKRGMGYHCRW